MDQTLLKYWKTCLQDAERKAIALKGPRITLNIGDKILKFIPLKSIPVIFPDWKAEDSNEKQKVMIAPCILLPEFENGWTSQSERPEYPFLITATMLPDGKLTVCENESDRIPIFIRKFLEPPAPRMDLKTADFQRFFFCENQILPLLLPLSFIFI